MKINTTTPTCANTTSLFVKFSPDKSENVSFFLFNHFILINLCTRTQFDCSTFRAVLVIYLTLVISAAQTDYSMRYGLYALSACFFHLYSLVSCFSGSWIVVSPLRFRRLYVYVNKSKNLGGGTPTLFAACLTPLSAMSIRLQHHFSMRTAVYYQ